MTFLYLSLEFQTLVPYQEPHSRNALKLHFALTFTDTIILPILFRRTTLVSTNFCTPLKFLYSIYIFPTKYTGTYSSKRPANPHKIKVSSTASRQFQHALKLYFALTFAHAVLDFPPIFKVAIWQSRPL